MSKVMIPNSTQLPIDIKDFESLSAVFYDCSVEGDRSRAIINELSSHQYSLYIFHTLLMEASLIQAKYICLSVISMKIKTQWNIFCTDQKNILKRIYFDMACQQAQTEDVTRSAFLRQIDNVVVQIGMEEWPEKWPNFIHKLVTSYGNDAMIAINCIYILKLLSEKIRTEKLVVARKIELTNALFQNFNDIFSFFKLVLTQSKSSGVKYEAFMALAEYLTWETLKPELVEEMCFLFFDQLLKFKDIRVPILLCIYKSISNIVGNEIFTIFRKFISIVSQDIEMLSDPQLIPFFVDIIGHFMCMNKGALMPNDTIVQWMIEYTKIVDDSIFPKVVDSWYKLTKIFIFGDLSLPFSNVYLLPLQYALCSRMPRPYEYNGDKLLYSKISDTLNLLLQIHKSDILQILIQRIDQNEFTYDMLPYIFSIGAITICDFKEEKEFLDSFINIFLKYLNSDNEINVQKATVAFIYVIAHYPRYLSSNQEILELTLHKYFDYLRSDNEAIQGVAIKAFVNLSKTCGKTLVERNYIQKFFEDLPELLKCIPSSLHYDFYQCYVYFITYCNDVSIKNRMILTLFQHAYQIEIYTLLITISDSTFQTPIEEIVQGYIKTFVESQNEQQKHMIFELYEAFLERFPNSPLVSHLFSLFQSDFENYHSAEDFDCLIILIKKGFIDLIPQIYECFLMPTYQELSSNYTEYPDLRESFFDLIQAILQHFLKIDHLIFTELLKYLFFGISHPQTDISSKSMNCISSILSFLNSNEHIDLARAFYSAFYFEIMSELVDNVFDGLHTFLFTQTTQAIHYLFQVASCGNILDVSAKRVTDFLFEKLSSLFHTFNPESIQKMADDLINNSSDLVKIRQSINDFIITSSQIELNENESMEFDINEMNGSNDNTFDEIDNEMDISEC